MNEPTVKLRFETARAAAIKYRVEMRKAAALSLAVACASAATTRNAAQTGQGPAIGELGATSGNEAPEILRLEGGELVATRLPLFRNRFSISYRPSFNITAEFKNLGFPPATVPGPGGGLVDRNYDNGYVRLETTGLAAGSPDGYTSNWSYQNSGQVVGNSLLMTKTASAGTVGSSGALDDDPQPGMEFLYSLALGPVGRFSWGIEGSFGFAGLDIQDTRSLNSDINVITDTFDISNLESGGGPPPPPGTPTPGRSGTSALILVEPASRSSTIFAGSTINGYRSVEANVFDFRVGPYLEIQLARRVGLTLSGGLGLAWVDSTFAYNETLQLPGAGQLVNAGSGSQSDLLVGAYASANVSYAVADAWRLFAGVQYRNLGSFNQSVNGAEVEIDFGNALYTALGVSYSF